MPSHYYRFSPIYSTRQKSPRSLTIFHLGKPFRRPLFGTVQSSRSGRIYKRTTCVVEVANVNYRLLRKQTILSAFSKKKGGAIRNSGGISERGYLSFSDQRRTQCMQLRVSSLLEPRYSEIGRCSSTGARNIDNIKYRGRNMYHRGRNIHHRGLAPFLLHGLLSQCYVHTKYTLALAPAHARCHMCPPSFSKHVFLSRKHTSGFVQERFLENTKNIKANHSKSSRHRLSSPDWNLCQTLPTPRRRALLCEYSISATSKLKMYLSRPRSSPA